MSITSGGLSINGFEQIDEILELEINEKPSGHPKARFRAGIIEGADLKKLQSYDQDFVVRIKGKDNKTGEVLVLFAGYIEDLQIHDMGANYYELEVNLIGTSCKLDQDKRNRSFQDVSLTHEDVVKKAGSSTKGTSITWNAEAAQGIKMPVIQYVETDWEFILRMASIYNSSVFENTKADYPVLSVGMELSDSGVEFDNRFYKVGVSKRFYELGGKKAGLIKKNFQYYQITSRKHAAIGEYVTFQGRKFAVCEKKTRLAESEIMYTYRISTPDYGKAKTIYNGTFIGHTILGKVLETKGETLKLDLELSDDEHNDSVAYPYNWTPETGNIMYCMPKVGTKVSLYFSDEEESSGTVVNCIRTNGGTSAKMDNPSNKHFTSEDGLMMDLNLDDMNFATSEDKEGNAFSRFFLDDASSITFETKGSIKIGAKESIEVNGKYIFIGAANGEMTLVGSVKSSQASFYFHYQFDALGEISSMTGTDFDTYPVIMDEPLAGTLPKPKKKSSGWGLFGKVMAGLAAAAVATAAVCLIATGVGAGAGVVLGIAAAGMVSGAFAVGSMAVEEAKTGESKSLMQYVGNGFAQGLFGAASAAIGGGIGSISGKLFLEMGTTVVSTATDNLIQGKEWDDNMLFSLGISALTFGLFDTGFLKNIPIFKRIPGLADAAESAGEQMDNLGREAAQATSEAAAARSAKEAASEAAENATREEAEKAAREEAARRAERIAEQTRNRVRNNRSSSRTARNAAQDALTDAKMARRAAVAEHVAATATKDSAERAAREATEAAATKAAVAEAANKAAKKAAVNKFNKELEYNLAKSSANKVEEKVDEKAAPYYKPIIQYIQNEISKEVAFPEE